MCVSGDNFFFWGGEWKGDSSRNAEMSSLGVQHLRFLAETLEPGLRLGVVARILRRRGAANDAGGARSGAERGGRGRAWRGFLSVTRIHRVPPRFLLDGGLNHHALGPSVLVMIPMF